MSDPYPITITREDLAWHDACAEGIDAFDAFVPDGVLTIADVTAHVALLSTPLARFERWAVKKGVLPPIHIVAGSYGQATAGTWGTATAGTYGHAAAGRYGQATAGYGGRATAGYGGRATAGYGGTATAGVGGRATAGLYGLATASHYGRIEVDWCEGGRVRTAVGYIGEALDRDGVVLAPGVAYKADLEGQFYRA